MVTGAINDCINVFEHLAIYEFHRPRSNNFADLGNGLCETRFKERIEYVCNQGRSECYGRSILLCKRISISSMSQCATHIEKLTESPQDAGTFGKSLADMLLITLSNNQFIKLGIQVDIKASAKVILSVWTWSKVAPSGP